MTDYYDVLEVPRDATQADVERAYREKVKEHHPDVSDHPKAAERFQAVVDAEAVLGDEDERARYDRLGHDAYQRVVGEGRPPPDDGGSGTSSSGSRSGTASDGSSGGSSGGGPSTDGTSAGSGSSAGDGLGDVDWGGGATTSGSNPTQRGYSPWKDEDDDSDPGETDWWTEQFGDENPFAEAAQATPGATTSRRERRTSRAARAGPTGKGNGFWAAETDRDDWSEVTTDPSPSRGLSFDGKILAIGMLIIYPVFIFFSLTPALPLAANIVVAVATATVVVFLFTEVTVSVVVYGVWSVLAPLVMTFVGQPLVTPKGVAALGAFWGPLAIALLLSLALPD